MTGSTLKLCVFDLDGTLVDSQHHILAAMERAFIDEGLAMPEPRRVREVVGLPLDVAIRRLAPEVSGLWAERIGNRYRDAYFDLKADGQAAEPLMSGAREVVDALEARGWLLAIVTGKGRRGLQAVLDAHGLSHRFVSLKSADDGPGKPDPTLLFDAIDEAGAEVTRSVMVGDTVFDLRMARLAGVAALGVSWGYHSRPMLEAEGPAAILERFDDLPALAERLVGNAKEAG